MDANIYCTQRNLTIISLQPQFGYIDLNEWKPKGTAAQAKGTTAIVVGAEGYNVLQGLVMQQELINILVIIVSVYMFGAWYTVH